MSGVRVYNLDADGNLVAAKALTIDGEDGLPSGVIAALGTLGSGAVITEKALGELFDRSSDSVKRAVKKGELPPPVRQFGQNAWTAGVLVKHIEQRLEQAAKKVEAEEQRAAEHDDAVRQKMLKLSP